MMNQKPTVVLSALTVDEINLVLAGLGKLPLELTVDLWMRVRREAQEQIEAASSESPPNT